MIAKSFTDIKISYIYQLIEANAFFGSSFTGKNKDKIERTKEKVLIIKITAVIKQKISINLIETIVLAQEHMLYTESCNMQ